MAVKVGQITNSDIYMDGGSLAGRIKEFSIDAVAYKEVEHDTLGMVGMLSLPGRGLEKLAGKIIFDYLDPEILVKTLNPTKAFRFMAQSYVDIFGVEGLDGSQSVTLTHFVTVLFRTGTMDALKLGEGIGIEHEVNIMAYVLKSSKRDTPIREIDIFNGIDRIDGQDVWPR